MTRQVIHNLRDNHSRRMNRRQTNQHLGITLKQRTSRQLPRALHHELDHIGGRFEIRIFMHCRRSSKMWVMSSAPQARYSRTR